MSAAEASIGRLLGLARRGRNLVMGVPQVEQALRRGDARLVLLATDGSFGQKKGVFGLSRRDQIPVIERFTSTQMAEWIGVNRVTALAVTEPHLARGIRTALDGMPESPAPPDDGLQDRPAPSDREVRRDDDSPEPARS